MFIYKNKLMFSGTNTLPAAKRFFVYFSSIVYFHSEYYNWLDKNDESFLYLQRFFCTCNTPFNWEIVYLDINARKRTDCGR